MLDIEINFMVSCAMKGGKYMEILFENKYVRNKEWAKEVYRYIYFGRPLVIALEVMLVVSFILGIIYTKWHVVFSIGLTVFFFVLMCVRNVKTLLKRDLELHGKAVEVIVTVTDQIIHQWNSTGAQYHLNYVDIKRVVRTPKYIYLWSKSNMLYTLKKDSFSVGDDVSFLIFLNNKGVKAK